MTESSPSPRPAWPHSVSAVLPAFNESAVIADVVRGADRALIAAGLAEHEVIVVDDGSTDGTGALLEALCSEVASLRVVHHPANRGYGGALRSGFEAATMDAVWLMDGDGQFDPADLPLLLAVADTETVVAGYRRHREDPLMRRLNHNAFFALVRLSFGHTVRDVNCAFKLFPRKAGQGLHADGAMISTELIIRARQAGLAIAEVAIPHHPRTAGTPTGANPRVVVRAFQELWTMRVGLRAQRAPDAPVSESAASPPSL